MQKARVSEPCEREDEDFSDGRFHRGDVFKHSLAMDTERLSGEPDFDWRDVRGDMRAIVDWR